MAPHFETFFCGPALKSLKIRRSFRIVSKCRRCRRVYSPICSKRCKLASFFKPKNGGHLPHNLKARQNRIHSKIIPLVHFLLLNNKISLLQKVIEQINSCFVQYPEPLLTRPPGSLLLTSKRLRYMFR